MTTTRLATTLGLLVLCLSLATAAFAQPDDPVTVTPVPDVPDIFSPGIRLVADLEQAYVEEEFFVEGAATVYTYNDPPVREEVVPLQEDVPYATRIIVRRPADPTRFRGTVVIEWWNSTAGFDTAPVWDASAEFYAREGWIYVGVTNSNTSITHLVNGCSLFVGLLPQTCTGRYDTPSITLSLPENGQAYEMVSQIANLLRSDSPENPIPPEYGYVDRLYHSGQSQQGGSMVTYATAFHSSVNDGYFIQAASSARSINSGTACTDPEADPYPDCTPRLEGDQRRVRTDLPVPVYRAMTETDVRGVISSDSRQEDTATFRYYEMPGTAHSTVHVNVQVLPPLPPFFPDGLFLEDTCALPLNTLADGPVFGSYLYNAMWQNMELTSRYGFPAPHGNLIDVVDDAIARDEFGNALGGIRLPMVEVPIATYGPNNLVSPTVPAPLQPLLGLFCVLSGTVADFDAVTLVELYPTNKKYVGKVSFSALRLFLHRFLLIEDLVTIIHDAKNSGIGTPGPRHCGLGFELILVVPPLLWLHGRRRRGRTRGAG